MYLGLIVTLIVYVLKFFVAIWDLIVHVNQPQEEVLLSVVGQLDIVMVANLIVMILIGSYTTFVSELHFDEKHVKPQWLNHISSSILKVKMSASIVGVSSIHLLQTFIKTENVWIKLAIHGAFIVGLLVLWFTAKGDTPHHEETPHTPEPHPHTA